MWKMRCQKLAIFCSQLLPIENVCIQGLSTGTSIDKLVVYNYGMYVLVDSVKFFKMTNEAKPVMLLPGRKKCKCWGIKVLQIEWNIRF